MNIRCFFCQTPYAIGRNEILAALQHMQAENLNHYDAHCPRCRRATPILRQKLEMAFPNWQEALKEAIQDAEAAPAPPSQPKSAPVAERESKPASKAASKPRARSGAKKPESQKAPSASAPKARKTSTKKSK